MKPHPLKVAREARGWSQSKVAKALGVNTRTVGRWELRLVVPHPHYREQLSLLFGKTIEELGLLEDDSDAHNSVEETSLSAKEPILVPDIVLEEPSLIDPFISKVQGNSNGLLLGRDSLLAQVKQQLFKGKNIVLTAQGGLPGIGKTALATALAKDEQIQAHFHNRILWARSGPRPNVLDEFARWGKLLRIAPSQVEDLNSREAWRQALRTAIGTDRLLLVIDDAWTAEDALVFQVGGAQCTYLMTTRHPQLSSTFNQQETIFIPPLEEADGLALLAHFALVQVRQNPAGATELVRAVNGLPLALTLIGKHLASGGFTGQPQPLQAALAQFHDIEQHLDTSMAIAPGKHSPSLLVETMPLSLLTAITICDQQLSPQAQEALRALSIFPAKPMSFSEEAALVLSQQPVEVLHELRDSGLLENWGSERYALHQAIADYAHAQSKALVARGPQVSSQTNDIQMHERDKYAAGHYRFLYPSFWNPGIDYIRYMSAFGSSNRFSRRPLLIVAMILLALLVIIATPLAFNGLPFSRVKQYSSPIPTSTNVQVSHIPPLYQLTIQNTDPSLLDIAQHFNQVFNAVYPQLVNRFGSNPTTAASNVTLIFSSNLSSPTSISGTTITISSDWLRQHPNDFGLLTHELALLVEQYPSGTPGWFTDGMADYARSVYGPADDDNWSLPNGVQPQDSYLQGGGAAARFLLWLEQNTTLDVLDQLNHALQTGQSLPVVFHRLTHHTVDQLWKRYQQKPDIMLTPDQLYKTVTSRKPLYQISSLNLQFSQPRSFLFSAIPGLFVSNFAIQADITTIYGDGGGFIFRWQTIHSNPADPQYRIRLHPIVDKTYGTFDLVRPDTTLAFGSSSAIRQGYNRTNRLTIIAQKHSIYLYINSQFMIKVDDNLSSDGVVAAMANDDSHPTEVRFANIQVF